MTKNQMNIVNNFPINLDVDFNTKTDKEESRDRNTVYKTVYVSTKKILNWENSNTLLEEIGTIKRNEDLDEGDYNYFSEVEIKLITVVPYRKR